MTIPVNPNWWKEIFDDLYLLTDGRSVCDDILTAREVNFIESALDADKAVPILDLCGGQGRHALEMSRRGFSNVSVLDYSSRLIEIGKQTAEQEALNTAFFQGDARETGLDSGTFGALLIMGGSFGYFVDDKENEKILSEACRLLQSKGTLLLDLPDKSFVLDNFQPVSTHTPKDTIQVTRSRELHQDIIYCRETVTSEDQGCLRDNTYCIRLYDPDNISRLLEACGFDSISFQEDFMDRNAKGDYGTMTNRMVVMAQKCHS